MYIHTQIYVNVNTPARRWAHSTATGATPALLYRPIINMHVHIQNNKYMNIHTCTSAGSQYSNRCHTSSII